MSVNMANNVNQITALRTRRINNYKMQLRSVLLEGYEIFGADITDQVIKDCKDVYLEWLSINDGPVNKE